MLKSLPIIVLLTFFPFAVVSICLVCWGAPILGAYMFIIVISSSQIDPVIIMYCPSLSLETLYFKVYIIRYDVVQMLICVWLFAIPWTIACQTSHRLSSPRTCWNSYPLSWWCHPTISSFIIPFSFFLQSDMSTVYLLWVLLFLLSFDIHLHGMHLSLLSLSFCMCS